MSVEIKAKIEKHLEFGQLTGYSLMKDMFTYNAESPDPPAEFSPFASRKTAASTSSAKKKSTAKSNKPTEPFQDVDTQNYRRAFVSNPVLPWGERNTWPQLVTKEALKCDTLQSGLKRIGDHLYGQGFYLYKEVFKDGRRSVEEVEEPEVWQMLESTGYWHYYNKARIELPLWGNVFPVYLFDSGKGADRKIAQIKLYDTPWCRLERPDPDTGKIEAIYVSAQWDHGLVLSGKNALKDSFMSKWVFRYEMMDENNWLDQMTLETGINTWVQHLKYHTSGKAYGRAPWHSAYENRWTALSAAVPEMKMRLYEYAMTINYLVYIDEEYWAGKYGADGWNEWDTTQKQQKIIAKQKEIEEHLAGSKNAWKTLFVSKEHDDNGNDIKSILIEPINNTLKEGNYIPDSQIADTHILQSLGVDPSLMGSAGNSAGSKQSAGSGSNIREASLALSSILRPDRDLLHIPFTVLMRNNFPDKTYLKIGTRDYVINTLDGQRPASGSEATAV